MTFYFFCLTPLLLPERGPKVWKMGQGALLNAYRSLRYIVYLLTNFHKSGLKAKACGMAFHMFFYLLLCVKYLVALGARVTKTSNVFSGHVGIEHAFNSKANPLTEFTGNKDGWKLSNCPTEQTCKKRVPWVLRNPVFYSDFPPNLSGFLLS